MARYEHLPIYKQAMDVAVHFEKVVAGFCELPLRGIPAYPASGGLRYANPPYKN